MPQIRIRIGAVLDGDLGDTVFRPTVEASRRAKKQIDANLSTTARKSAGPGGRDASKDLEREVTRAAKQRVALEKAATREIEADLKRHSAERAKMDRDVARSAKQRAGEEKKAMKEVEDFLQRRNKDSEKMVAQQTRAFQVAQRRNQHIADSAALRVSSSVVRGAGNFVRRGAGIAGDIARGAGVDVNLSGAVAARSKLEATATDISASAFMPGSGVAKVDPRALMKQAQDISIGTGVGSSQDVLQGLQEFVSKTGDLETGRNVLADMAKLSAATGSSLSDVVSAAGDVSSNIGDVGKEFSTAEEKAAAVERTMRMIASGGKLGAVEMRDFASQMAKVASRASEFGGNKEDTVAMLGALAQESRAKGGSASASQAATSVGSFVNTFTKGARRKQFASGAGTGKAVQIEDATGQLLSAKDIIINSLRATNGDKEKMGKLFMDANARRVTRGFESTYHQAGGGQKGLDAVAAEFDKLLQPMLSKEQVNQDAEARKATMQSQATILQEQFNKQLGDAAEKVAPKLMSLVPIVAKLVDTFASLVSWAASNPLQAAFTGLGAVVMKSIGEEMMRAGTERMLGGLVGPMAVRGAAGTGPGTQVSSGGGFMGNAATALAITATAVTLYSAGTTLIDKAFDEKNKGQNGRMEDELEGANAKSKLFGLERSSGDLGPVKREAGETFEMARSRQQIENAQAIEAAKAQVATKRDALVKRQKLGEEYSGMTGSEAFSATIDAYIQKALGNGAQANDLAAGADAAANQKEITGEIASLTSALTGGVLRVEVVNQPGGPAPFVNPGGRTQQ